MPLKMAIEGMRDGVVAEMGIRIEDGEHGKKLVLDVRPAARKRQTEIALYLDDLEVALRFLRDRPQSAAVTSRASAQPDVPVLPEAEHVVELEPGTEAPVEASEEVSRDAAALLAERRRARR
jgi:hypothetical protein